MKKTITFLSSLTLTSVAMAQDITPELSWIDQIRGSETATAQGNQTIDADGNRFVAVTYAKGSNLYLTSNSTEVSPVSNGSSKNLSVTKFGKDNTFQWGIYSSAGDFETASTCLAATADGSLILAAKGKATGDNDTTAPTLVDAKSKITKFEGWTARTAKTYDIILAKYSAGGAIQWTKTVDIKSGGSVTLKELAVDENDNIYLCGYSQDALIFNDNATLSPTSHAPVGAFLVKLDKEGNLADTLAIQSPTKLAEVQIWTMTYSNGVIYFAGRATASTEADKLTIGGQEVAISSTDLNLLYGAINASDLSCAFVKSFQINSIATESSTGSTVYNKDLKPQKLSVIGDDVYMAGQFKGRFIVDGQEVLTSDPVDNSGTLMRFSTTDGTLEKYTINNLTIGGFYGAFEVGDSIIAPGYAMISSATKGNYHGMYVGVYDKDLNLARTEKLMESDGLSTVHKADFCDTTLYLMTTVMQKKKYTFVLGQEVEDNYLLTPKISTVLSSWKMAKAVEKEDNTAISSVRLDADAPNNVYDLQGRLIKANATKDDINALPHGFYLVGDQKLIK